MGTAPSMRARSARAAASPPPALSADRHLRRIDVRVGSEPPQRAVAVLKRDGMPRRSQTSATSSKIDVETPPGLHDVGWTAEVGLGVKVVNRRRRSLIR